MSILLIFTISLIPVLIYSQEYNVHQTTGFINKCASPDPNIGNATIINIPSNFTRHGRKADVPALLSLQQNSLKCKESTALNHVVLWKDGSMKSPQSKSKHSWTRSFSTAAGASKYIPPHFLEDASFFNGNFYFRADGDYCIQSQSNTSITLRLCPPNSEDIYLPKCCALDEVKHIARRCIKLPKNETRWKPELYIADSNGKHLPFNYNPKNLKIYMENLTSKCRPVEGLPKDFFSVWSPANPGAGGGHNVKLAVRKGNPKNVFPIVFYPSIRKWLLKENVHFCVDGTYLAKGAYPNWTPHYRGDPKDFVIYLCTSDIQTKVVKQDGKTWAYAFVTLISSCFLFVTVVIYLLLLKQHNLHGLTVLMYSSAMLGRYLFACIAYFISLYPNYEMTGVSKRGWPCVTIGILGHYFFLTGYLWLTVMNFNFLRIFWKPKVVQRQGKELKTLLVYSLIAWGLPVILVGTFIGIDHAYLDPLTEVPVPGYGDKVCYVARPFRGHYVYTPMGIMLVLNMPLIALTFHIFWNARTMRRKSLHNENSSTKGNTADFSAIFFLKLFIIMGGRDLISFLTWYYHEPIQADAMSKPVWVIVLESGNYLTPVLLFGLFCLNQSMRKHLLEWYDKSPVNFSSFAGRTGTMSATKTGEFKLSKMPTGNFTSAGESTN